MTLNNLCAANSFTLFFVQQQTPVWMTPELINEVTRPITNRITDLFTEMFPPNSVQAFWGLGCLPAILPTMMSVDLLTSGQYKDAAKLALLAAPYFIAMGIICNPTQMTAIDTAAKLTIPVMNYVLYKNANTIFIPVVPIVPMPATILVPASTVRPKLAYQE